jgi:hypothetical protein
MGGITQIIIVTMKKKLVIPIVVLFCFVQCKVANSSKIIQYVLPYQVELALIKQMQIEGEQPVIFFSLRKDAENYVIILVQCNREELKRIDKFNLVAKTSRYLLIGKKFYPLLFDMDYQFGTILKRETLNRETQERWTNESFGIPRSFPIYDGAFSLIFSSSGEIFSK